jgi:hypothetical protein
MKDDKIPRQVLAFYLTAHRLSMVANRSRYLAPLLFLTTGKGHDLQ